MNRKIYLHLCWLTLFLISSCVAQTDPKKGKVTGIKDGDTIEVLLDGKPEKIRLFGIDCPERNQDYGSAAEKFTSSVCFGKIVEVKIINRDKYKRLLAIVILPSGKNLNQELVREGFAWKYKHSKDTMLQELQMEAKENKRGLWALQNPIPPWEFRYKAMKERQRGKKLQNTIK